MNAEITRLDALKTERDAIIMAHYYAPDEVQDVADYIGDSFYLATVAARIACRTVVLCGVTFMAESAKILSREKTVLVPALSAVCPMAGMATAEQIREARREHGDIAVVCYVNSTAAVKAESDVCVTSSNAVKIAAKLPQKNLYFTPDRNLGAYIQSKLPDKHIVWNDGFCCVHDGISGEQTARALNAHRGAKLLAHPECRTEVLAYADYVGSTAGMLDYVTRSPERVFIVATETGILHQMRARCPDKLFYTVNSHQFCKQMKHNTVAAICAALETLSPQMTLDDALAEKAYAPLSRMVEFAAET
jgi:quinolinate synthase